VDKERDILHAPYKRDILHAMKTIAFHPTEFTAREAARITGRDEAQQRSDRRHGHLKKMADGWTRYTIKSGLSELLVLQALSDRGVPPATVKAIATSAASAAVAIAAWAQQCPGAVVDSHLADELPIKTAPDFLSRNRYLVWDGIKASFQKDLSTFFDSGSIPAETRAAAVILDLKSLAETLVQRAGALWTVVQE